MKKILYSIIPVIAFSALVSCGEKQAASNSASNTSKNPSHGDHAHDEVKLGSFNIGKHQVEAAQGHGKVEANKEGHIVVKLPYNDSGKSLVRAWIGTKDRTLSAVGKGVYTSSKDNYNVHAVAPSPLPKGTKWWVEITAPDGSKSVGSIPLLKDTKKEKSHDHDHGHDHGHSH